MAQRHLAVRRAQRRRTFDWDIVVEPGDTSKATRGVHERHRRSPPRPRTPQAARSGPASSHRRDRRSDPAGLELGAAGGHRPGAFDQLPDERHTPANRQAVFDSLDQIALPPVIERSRRCRTPSPRSSPPRPPDASPWSRRSGRRGDDDQRPDRVVRHRHTGPGTSVPGPVRCAWPVADDHAHSHIAAAPAPAPSSPLGAGHRAPYAARPTSWCRPSRWSGCRCGSAWSPARRPPRSRSRSNGPTAAPSHHQPLLSGARTPATSPPLPGVTATLPRPRPDPLSGDGGWRCDLPPLADRTGRYRFSVDGSVASGWYELAPAWSGRGGVRQSGHRRRRVPPGAGDSVAVLASTATTHRLRFALPPAPPATTWSASASGSTRSTRRAGGSTRSCSSSTRRRARARRTYLPMPFAHVSAARRLGLPRPHRRAAPGSTSARPIRRPARGRGRGSAPAGAGR